MVCRWFWATHNARWPSTCSRRPSTYHVQSRADQTRAVTRLLMCAALSVVATCLCKSLGRIKSGHYFGPAAHNNGSFSGQVDGLLSFLPPRETSTTAVLMTPKWPFTGQNQMLVVRGQEAGQVRRAFCRQGYVCRGRGTGGIAGAMQAFFTKQEPLPAPATPEGGMFALHAVPPCTPCKGCWLSSVSTVGYVTRPLAFVMLLRKA